MRTVFLDLDGVLCDFVQGVLRSHGATLPIMDVTWDFAKQIGFKRGWSDPDAWAPMRDPAWWAGLTPLDDGMDLFRRVEAAVGKDRIGFLSCAACPGSAEGKRAWLAKHLPGYEGRTVFATMKHLAAAPSKVLVDDADHNIFGSDKHVGWVPAGGRGCLPPRPWNRNRQLCDAHGRFQVGQVLDDLIPLIEGD